jgi:hypothetical protein
MYEDNYIAPHRGLDPESEWHWGGYDEDEEDVGYEEPDAPLLPEDYGYEYGDYEAGGGCGEEW